MVKKVSFNLIRAFFVSVTLQTHIILRYILDPYL